MAWNEAESLSMQTISSISAIASFTVVAIYLRFPHLRKKPYFTLQFYVALSNVLTSIGSAIGVVETGSVACWFQGILTNIFTLSSIHWTTVMAFSLFSIVHYEKQIEVTPLIHAYCWIPPILATLLPLINSTYGNVGNWCWVINTSKTPPWGEMFWFWFSYYGWVWLGLFIMTVIFAEINYSIRRRKTTATLQKLQKVITTLNLFPLIILIAWGPACASDTIYQMFNEYNPPFGVVSTICACLQGLLTALLFWSRNSEVRKLVPLIFKTNAPIRIERVLTSGSSSLGSNSAGEDSRSSLYWSSFTDQFHSLRSKFKIYVPITPKMEAPTTLISSSSAALTTPHAIKYHPSAESRSTISGARSSTRTGNLPVEEQKSHRSFEMVQEFQGISK